MMQKALLKDNLSQAIRPKALGLSTISLVTFMAFCIMLTIPDIVVSLSLLKPDLSPTTHNFQKTKILVILVSYLQ